MKLEVGKRYVMRNGEVVGPIESYGGGEFNFTDRLVRDERGRIEPKWKRKWLNIRSSGNDGNWSDSRLSMKEASHED